MTSGPAHRTPRPLPRALAVAALALTAACTGPHDTTAAPANSPYPHTTSPTELCVSLLTHWAREELAGRAQGDYQQKALSNGQNEILLAVVEAARGERERAGPEAADRLAVAEIRRRCTERYEGGSPTTHPWR
ncbi:hypothetical protein [Streptomyces sp. TRM64462]|uniref:hypothetical protein n=1 Tax=Streptomyces sp. TRM64462 TaxID=2741726 RepID=UPI001586F7A2|nr:hypothetical protein [Streptomyces sp. TRM64462]